MPQSALKGAVLGVPSLLLAILFAMSSGAQEAEVLPPPHVPKPADDGRPAELKGARDLACAKCHTEILNEWATTLHAMAWVDARYQKDMLKKRKPRSCQGCHIPEPIFDGAIGRKFRPRDETEGSRPVDQTEALAWNPRHFGISCVTCHLAPDGAMLGPYESDPESELSEAHASRQHEAFGGTLSNALCINCHRTNVGPVIGIAKDFESSRQADKGQSCVGCHMQEVERSAANGIDETGKSWSSLVRPGRSHALETPRNPQFLKEAFGIEVRKAKGGAELVISNQAGHRIPGLRTRSMTFTVTALDPDGRAVGQIEQVFTSDSYLPVDGVQSILVESSQVIQSIRVRAEHDWVGVKQAVLFIDEHLQL